MVLYRHHRSYMLLYGRVQCLLSAGGAALRPLALYDPLALRPSCYTTLLLYALWPSTALLFYALLLHATLHCTPYRLGAGGAALLPYMLYCRYARTYLCLLPPYRLGAGGAVVLGEVGRGEGGRHGPVGVAPVASRLLRVIIVVKLTPRSCSDS